MGSTTNVDCGGRRILGLSEADGCRLCLHIKNNNKTLNTKRVNTLRTSLHSFLKGSNLSLYGFFRICSSRVIQIWCEERESVFGDKQPIAFLWPYYQSRLLQGKARRACIKGVLTTHDV